MMNYIWTALLLISLIFSVFTGNMAELSSSVLEGAANAVNIVIKLLGALVLWNGIEEIISLSGADKIIEKLLSPFMKLIFPKYHKTDAGKAISANISANLLGLGNAATPLGLEAMRRIKSINGSDTSDNETVRFVVINSAALTLIPTSVAAIRSAHGSNAPFSVIFPVWLTGITALFFGLAAERLLSKRWK